jgi:tRNA-2-methylthio-N6-dimethylallyladenosine synthase
MIFNVHNTEYESDISEIRELILGQGKKACVITFGCQQNEADGEKMAGMLSSMGYLLSDNCDECDIILVNTCAIREHAEAKALSLLGRFKSIKKKNPELILGVCGCMAAESHRAEMLKRDFH